MKKNHKLTSPTKPSSYKVEYIDPRTNVVVKEISIKQAGAPIYTTQEELFEGEDLDTTKPFIFTLSPKSKHKTVLINNPKRKTRR